MNAVDDEVSLESLKNHSGVLRLYLRRGNFKKNGQEYVTNCPFHLDKTPSCKLNCKTGGWLFFCHGCQSGGSIIDFVMQSDHLDLGAAIQTIKKELGIGAPSTYKSAHKPDEFTKQKTFATIPLAAYVAVEHLLAQSQRAQDWLLKERGISYVTAKQLHIGYRQKIEATDETLKDILDKGWFVFPSIENDRVISIKYRSIVRKAFSRKFGMATALFNSETIDFLDDLYVTAGEWDALVLEQAGFHAVSIGSDTTPVTPEMITKLRLSDRVILAGDSDESGTRAMDKLQEKIPAALRLIWPGVKDANELWLKNRDDLEGFRNLVLKLTEDAVKAPIASAVEVPVEEDDAPESIPVCPPEIIDGDYIGELTRTLTEKTWIPPAFVRENIKTILGTMIDGEVGFPGHPDIHLRQYNINVSVQGRTGKGESWKRTGETPTGVLAGLLQERMIQVVDGSLFGSGEYMIKKLAQCAATVQHDNPAARVDVLARFDEMVEPFEKAKATGSTLESKFLQLFERNSTSHGSFKNGEHTVQDIHFSLSGDFTRDNFERAFAGRGSGGSGFLARCVYSYAKRSPHGGDWAESDATVRIKTLAKIAGHVTGLASKPDQAELFGDPDPPAKRFIPEETEGARKMRLDFFQSLNLEDERYTPELEAHFKRDLLMRTIFSDDQVIDEIRTGKSILWTRHQLEVRKLLWPEEAGSLVEMMELKLLKSLSDRDLSSIQLIRTCNVNRPGSGGRDVFNRAIKGLLINDIHVSGKTRKGGNIYGLLSRRER
jgi:hypothetical protein